MQEIPFSPTKLPLFPDNFRHCYLLSGLLTVVGLLLFSIFMFYVAFTQETEKLPCFIVGFLFAFFDTYCTVIWIKNLKIINAKYQISDKMVENYMGDRIISARLDKAYLHKKVSFRLSIGSGKIVIEYVAVSEDSISEDVCEEMNLYRKMKKAWDTNTVFIPSDAETQLP